MRNLVISVIVLTGLVGCFESCCDRNDSDKHRYNASYEGEYLNRIAFPIGGMGTGMFCWEGSGAISNMSLRHKPDVFFEPVMYAVIHVKDIDNGTKVLEGPVPDWKKFGMRNSATGGSGSWGLPRFDKAVFNARFPFATIHLYDDDIPLNVEMRAWNPFIPTDNDNASLPVGVIEYTFHNSTSKDVEAVFSYNSENFMKSDKSVSNCIGKMKNGFVLSQSGSVDKPYLQGDFAIFTDNDATVVDYCWFRGSWFDPMTMLWNDLERGNMRHNEPIEENAPGASLFVPISLKSGEKKTVRLYMAWYVPFSNIQHGEDALTDSDKNTPVRFSSGKTEMPKTYEPWYSHRFGCVQEVADYWLQNYNRLKNYSQLFTDAFFSSTLPNEVLEAVSANLSILKSTTVMRQHDGRMWNYEGTGDSWGSCPGSCTHVWNYAQAVPHLFPAMERSLRETEFFVDQNKSGHQMFRACLPIRPVKHNFYAAADGQLGGIIKVYRDWRICGDTEWLREIYPRVKESMDYCIETWDPRGVGALEEPHHNTYDIEFWGPDGMCTSFYAAALQSMVLLGKALNDDVSKYEALLAKSKMYLEKELYDGEYFIQNIRWKDLNADPIAVTNLSFGGGYSPEAVALLEKEGPKYQYGAGCLSDGVLGCYMAFTAGMEEPIDKEMVKSHLKAVYKYNFKEDLRDHSNPQRPTFALGNESGLLLCTWPKGGKLQLPFVYSNEVWTGIEYQVAAHLIYEGEVEKGLDIVRACRDRYNGKVRNPFNEYECGAWYARALASYSLLQALTGVRYDAVDETLYVDSKVGDSFKSFISTNTGFGTVELKNNEILLTVFYGEINPKHCKISGKEGIFTVKRI